MQFFIETERLIMRDMLPSDDEGMFALDSDAEVHRYLGGKTVQSIEESRRVIEFVREQYIVNGIGRWAVTEKSTGAFIGWAGMKYITEPLNGHTNIYDIGYRLIKKYWGRGYGTESALASVQYAWNVMQLKELYGAAAIDNIASRKILEKTGLQLTGTFDHNGIVCAWYKMARV
jgi:RimJ/RimL family protein N-acetyltransferase